MATLTREYTVGPSESDWLGVCRASAMQGFLMDAADRHARELGVAREDLRVGVVWMLSRVGYDLARPLRYGETFSVTTWHRGAEGPHLARDFLIRTQGQDIGRATSLWLLYDRLRNRIVKPDELDVTGTETAPPAPPLSLEKFKAPSELRPVGSLRASYTDLDLNEHVNNARYVDYCCNAVLDGGARAYIRSFRITYRHEVRLGQLVTQSLGDLPDGRVYVQGTVDDKPCYEASLLLKMV